MGKHKTVSVQVNEIIYRRHMALKALNNLLSALDKFDASPQVISQEDYSIIVHIDYNAGQAQELMEVLSPKIKALKESEG